MSEHFVREIGNDEFNEHDDSDTDDELSDGILYVAAPKSIYNTIKFNMYLSKIFADNPTYEIKIAKYEFGDSGHWKSVWLSLAPLIDKLIFVSDEDGFIGYGLWCELHTVLPETEIVYLTPEYEYVPMNRLAIQIFNEGLCWRHFSRIVLVTNVTDK